MDSNSDHCYDAPLCEDNSFDYEDVVSLVTCDLNVDIESFLSIENSSRTNAQPVRPDEATIEESLAPIIANDEHNNSDNVTSNTNDEQLESPCKHSSCNFPDYGSIAKQFRSMNVNERIITMRNIMFATTAPCDETNELSVYSRSIIAKKRRRQNEDARGRSTMKYCIKGRSMCREAFAFLFSLDEKTVERHASKVANGNGFISYECKLSESRKGKYGIQRIVVLGFLTTFQNTYGLESPSGRGSGDEAPLILIPSNFTKVDVYDMYIDRWKEIITAAMTYCKQNTVPQNGLSYTLFIRMWVEMFPRMLIAKSGSDFCDLCVKTKNDLKGLWSTDQRYQALYEMLTKHRNDAKVAHAYYKRCQDEAEDNSRIIHMVFDFAEKVLLPRLLKQPGQLHFVTSLKFDIFGVSNSNTAVNNIFGLPEGHWPNDKTSNVVISMLLHAFKIHIHNSGMKCDKLILHSDNCAGQNKNKFMMWFIIWMVIMDFTDQVELNFLIVGHTKNVCDGAFGHVKRALSKKDIHFPFEMMDLIEKSSKNNHCICSRDVEWSNWKEFLSQFFKCPSSFYITNFHKFETIIGNHGYLKCRERVDSEESKQFFFLKEGISIEHIRTQSNNYLSSFRSSFTALQDVPSAHQHNRKNYLIHNVVRRYFEHDESFELNYFADGSEFQNES